MKFLFEEIKKPRKLFVNGILERATKDINLRLDDYEQNYVLIRCVKLVKPLE